jgi:hypothetical protein
MTRRTGIAPSLVLTAIAVALSLHGCSAPAGDDAARAARDREQAESGWKLAIEDGGQAHELALGRMDIYLTEDEAYPEIFEILGEGVTLVGEFPAGVRVDYDEDFEKLVGQAIPVSASGGDPREPKSSSVTLGPLAAPVTGGSFTVEKVTGRWSGSEGDKTLHGTIELRIPSADGERTVRGRFAVHAVTWG